MDDNNAVFYPNMCFICHLTVNEATLKRCSACKIVPYCSEVHQQKHWKKHKKLCGIIERVSEMLKPEELENKENWYKYRTKMMMLCELMMERKLCQNEVNMILFPSSCQICHTKTNLKACQKCLCVSYCSDDHRLADTDFHDAVCDSFALCLKLDLYFEQMKFYPSYRLRKSDMTLSDDMETFILSNVETIDCSSDKKDLELALISELITCPLSILIGLSKINFNFKENMTIHVVGSGMLETASMKSWEIFLHIHRNIQNLIVYFIGPEMVVNDDIDLCTFCKSKLIFQFSNKLYHDFYNTKQYQQPDVISSFNCGFHEFEDTDSDTWDKSLSLLIQNKNVPLILTSFTVDEANKDVKKLVDINQHLNVVKNSNQFASLRPFRDLENLGVYFNNAFISVVSSDL